MRTRILPFAGLLLLAASPALTRAAAPPGDAQPADSPALVVAVKSLDGLIADAKYIAELAGKDEEAKQAEKMLQNLLHSPKGVEGIDPKKPLGLYVRINADDPKASEVVALAPISDEGAFLKLLKRQEKIKVSANEDGSYEVTAKDLSVPVFFRFAHKYVYITAPDKAAIDADRLIAPDKVLPPESTSLASVVLHVDAIPENYKEMARTAVTQNLAKAKREDQPGETPAQKKFRLAAIDQAGALIKSVIDDGDEVSISLDVDQDAGELSASASFSAKPGSPLAESIGDLSKRKSIGAALVGSDSAVNLFIDLAMPEKLRKSLGDALDEAMKKVLASAAESGNEEAAEAFVKALLPTLKAGEVDAGFNLRGPSDEGHYTLVMGLKVQEGADIDKLFRDLVKSASPKDRKAVKLDVAKVGDVHIHKIIPDPKQMEDENSKRLFGDKPEIYFAIRDDAILISAGEGALDALKDALAAKPTTGATVQLEMSLSRSADLMVKDNPSAPDIAKNVFTDGKKDKVRFSLEGGKALTLKVRIDAPVVTFAAQLQEAQQKSSEDKDK